jgi:hypothetical protein
MVASGQLGLINDRGLVARLGDFYEHRQIRLMYNGESYDAAYEDVSVHYIPEVWDFRRHELITADYEKIAALHGRVLYIKGWAVCWHTRCDDIPLFNSESLLYPIADIQIV